MVRFARRTPAAAPAAAAPAGSGDADAAAAADPAVVVACGSCQPSPAAADGLVCRVRTADAVQEAPGKWDEESSTLRCRLHGGGGGDVASYEVLDKQSGRLVCAGGAGGSSSSGGACGGKRCDAPVVAASDAAGSGGGRVLARMSWIDRLLPLWIVAAMVLGVVLGNFAPSVRRTLQVLEIGGVALPIAIGLWLMMWPVLTKVRYELLGVLLKDRAVAREFAVSFALNWLLGPALMTGLAWACLPDLPELREGVIMVGLARCIAMVLLWNDLAGGNAELCAVLVALNSVLQIALYAPLSVLYLNVVSGSAAAHVVSFWPVAKSVLLFLGVPLVAGVLLRGALLLVASRDWFERRFMPWFGPLALLGLLYTIVVMFAAQGDKIVSQAGNVARVAVPMLIYFVAQFGLSWLLAWVLRMPYSHAVTQSFTAASNNFELAIAVAVGTFGVESQQALAATVGPLIEVPVLLGLVYVALALRSRVWQRAGIADDRASHLLPAGAAAAGAAVTGAASAGGSVAKPGGGGGDDGTELSTATAGGRDVAA